VLCDTNGGSMPSDVKRGVEAVLAALAEAKSTARVGIHTHNDCELAVANTLEGVMAGADMVQGTINGYGERCGNANLVSVAANLALKLGIEALPPKSLERLSDLSRTVAEIANLALPVQQPFVGQGAFAHKGGQHVAALLKHKDAYQHIDPALVGNQPRVLVSELSGRGNVLAKAREFGLELDRDDPQTRWLVQHLKELEHRGYSYEAADASFEMLIRRLQPGYVAPWTVADFTTQVRKNGSSVHAEATVKVEVDGAVFHTAASGNGPVNALDAALRKALSNRFPALDAVSLHDYKVRILDGDAGTAATTRVLIESGKDLKRWTTVGCSSNIIEASLLALVDSLEYAVTFPPPETDA
jgi:2-isopropylmalate synthase